MMPDNLIKEQLSLAYVKAVTARSGHDLSSEVSTTEVLMVQ